MTFFDTYSYKKKNVAMLVLLVLLGAVIYKHSISKTQELIAYRSELQGTLAKAGSAASDIRRIQKYIHSLNDYLGEENNSVEKVQQGFLNFFARKASFLTVHQIDEVITYQHPDFSIKTHRILLKGGYLSALRFIYALETEFDLARLIHVSYAYAKYPDDQHEALYITILLQNYVR